MVKRGRKKKQRRSKPAMQLENLAVPIVAGLQAIKPVASGARDGIKLIQDGEYQAAIDGAVKNILSLDGLLKLGGAAVGTVAYKKLRRRNRFRFMGFSI